MAITITIDNDRSTPALDSLTLDQSAGVQTPGGPDDGNDLDVVLSGGLLGGFVAPFNTYLNSLGLSAAQLDYARLNDGASSSGSFVQVQTSANEQISDLIFSDAAGNALDGDEVVGMLTLAGEKIYLFSSGDTAVAKAADGRIVAAFYLNEAADHKSAQIQMVTFEALKHTNSSDPDDTLNFTDVLQVSALGSLSFNFDKLESGNFLWAAVGSDTAGLLVTGSDLNVNDTASKRGDMVNGGSDPSDTVNTSQGGINATIGINSQHFVDGPKVNGKSTDGPTAVFTLVKGFDELQGAEQATGINVGEIQYDDYINSGGASVFISQVTGGTPTRMMISLWEAGGGDSSEHAVGALKPEEGYADGVDSYSYIGNQDTDSELNNDTPVNVATVSIRTFNWSASEAGISTTGVTKGGITVKIVGNDIIVTGALLAGDLISFTAVNDPASTIDGTFNRFTVQGLAGTGAFDIGRIDIAQGITVPKAVGGQLFVDDDGPSVTIDLQAGAEVRVDESRDQNVGESEVDSLGSVTVAAAVLFTGSRAYGTDGAATSEPDVYSLRLSSAGADSGLDDSATGQSVLLYTDGADIVGRVGGVGGTPVFRISIDAGSGAVTLTQYRAMIHGDPLDPDEADTPLSITQGLVAAVRTATDGDGDRDDDDADIGPAMKFEDDGPSVSLDLRAGAEVRVDESRGQNSGEDESGSLGSVTVTAAVLFTEASSYGSDGGAASNPSVYSLRLSSAGADSGLDDSATGQSVLLYADGADIVGRVGGAGGAPVFRIAIDAASGAVTLTQYRALTHGDPLDPDEADTFLSLAEGLVSAVRTVTDRDNDQDEDDADIGPALKFEDDGPSIGNISNAVVDFAKDASVTRTLNGAVGSDTKASPYTLTSYTASVTVGGVLVTGVANATSVTYWADTDGNGTLGSAGDTAYYRLSLDQSGAGSYTFDVLVSPPPSFTEFDFRDLPSGQNLFGLLVDYDDVGRQDLDGIGLLVVGRDASLNSAGAFTTSQSANSETINTSKGGGGVTIGIENQMFDQGEGAVFVFLKNPDDKGIAPHNVSPSVGPVGGLTQNTADDADTIGFADTQTAAGAEIEVVQKQGSEPLGMRISAFDVVLPNVANDGTKIVSANDPLGANAPTTDDVSADSRTFTDNPLVNAVAVSITAVQVINRLTGEVLEAVVNNNGVAVNVDDGSGPGKDSDSAVENAAGITVTFSLVPNTTDKYTATVTGFDANYTIAYQTAANHDAALVECTSGKWDLGGFNLQQGNDTPDQLFEFSARVTDADGDFATDNWSVGVDGTGAFDNGAVVGASALAVTTLQTSNAMDLYLF